MPPARWPVRPANRGWRRCRAHAGQHGDNGVGDLLRILHIGGQMLARQFAQGLPVFGGHLPLSASAGNCCASRRSAYAWVIAESVQSRTALLKRSNCGRPPRRSSIGAPCGGLFRAGRPREPSVDCRRLCACGESRVSNSQRHVGHAVQGSLKLLLPFGRDADAADQHLVALTADFQRVAQVRTQLVQRTDDLQFLGEGRRCRRFGGNGTMGPGGTPGWRGMPPVVPATVLAGFVCWSTNSESTSLSSTQSRLRNSKRPSSGARSVLRSFSVALTRSLSCVVVLMS